MYTETKARSLIKTIIWRIVATLNSWAILAAALSTISWKNAVLMNITGFVIYYLYERIWDKIDYGRVLE